MVPVVGEGAEPGVLVLHDLCAPDHPGGAALLPAVREVLQLLPAKEQYQYDSRYEAVLLGQCPNATTMFGGFLT